MRRIPRTFPIPSSNGTIVLKLEAPAVRAQNLVLEAWSSSYVLTQHLHEITSDFEPALMSLRKIRSERLPTPNGDDDISNIGAPLFPSSSLGVLELGAGIGLVGLAASSLWSVPLILTDLVPIVEPIISNIKLNADTLAANGGSACAGALDWDEPDTLSLYNGTTPLSLQASKLDAGDKAKIILAADVVYCEDHPRILTKAIFAWLSPGEEARVVIAYPLRIAYLDQIRELWERLDNGGLTSIREGRARADDTWDDEEEIEWCVWKWKA
ncbi:hypothetical protein EV356DRAFT_510703 [Viridothelium virens]|uniref:Uncharacterized protein n=1 Tax=Viridothelium virens TaxID=1048519 RepID=A0A6A6HII6_VIRVR|nr:hypothetical protein EV356DRAFT_510703 [Viridothelium virens]